MLAHAILGTFQVVGSLDNMTRKAKTFEDFIALLRDRHGTILSGRPETRPGEFKETPNQAGSTIFVAPQLVDGTRHLGWDLLNSLDHPFTRALFTMFVIAGVHPFNDGNGRIARAMMNAERVSGDHAGFSFRRRIATNMSGPRDCPPTARSRPPSSRSWISHKAS